MHRFLLPLLLYLPTSNSLATDLDVLRQRAVQGDAWAQLNLGAAYDNGLSGVAPDAVLAVRWYRNSAEQGLAQAQFNLAHCLATGHGVKQDLSEARRWMRRAAQQQEADAQFLLGVMLVEGMGGGIQLSEGYRWIQRAADAEQKDAQDYLLQRR